MKWRTRTSVFVAPVLISVGLTPTTSGALSTTRAQLKNGNELRVEGEKAVADLDISIDRIALGTADDGGDFCIEVTGFSSATCVITVSNGTDSESVPLDGCTPSGSPANQSPTAVAGPDQAVVDADDDGIETVILDGSGSTDDGTIVGFEQVEGPLCWVRDRRPRSFCRLARTASS